MIQLKNLTKSYPLNSGKRHYVFKDLNFTFPDNCSIGLMGRNGAGKSTLMRILGGMDMPDRGKVITDKKISFPIGLGAFFQGTLTARDNIKFLTRVYGYKGEALKEKIAFVEEFAELGKFFDEPISVLSSGMRSRISFGMSMAFDFDYYLIDEAGAVGDPTFKKKSTKLYQEKLSKSKVILVSHSPSEIRKWCDKIIHLDNGVVTIYDDVEEGIKAYQGK